MQGIRMFVDEGLGHSSYLVDLGGGGVAIVDPPRFPTAHVEAARMLDVRQRSEFTAGHVPGAINIELGSLADRAADIPQGPVTVMCGHGERAMTGASILARCGRGDVTVLAGGPESWSAAAGRPLEMGR